MLKFVDIITQPLYGLAQKIQSIGLTRDRLRELGRKKVRLLYLLQCLAEYLFPRRLTGSGCVCTACGSQRQ